jgi:hypothetical protein
MKTQPAYKDTCWYCGVLHDNENVIFMLTRLDPHTRVMRPVTHDEKVEMPEDFKEAHNYGYRVSALCLDCAKKRGIEKLT